MSTAIASFGIGSATNSSQDFDRPRSARLHLTRRGRVVLTTLISVPLVLAAFGFAINSGGATATDQPGSALHYVTVQGGETLWHLATTVAPSADPRDVIADIVQLNQLSSSQVQPGQRIAVPSQYQH
jgi:hypothetical protein